MLNELCDYMDYGNVDGTFDVDQVSTFEYEGSDTIIPMKNGPLDTVDELRYLPGMTDELFNAVKPFLTVYPGDYKKGVFFATVNVNAAPVEVLYAIYRGTSYQSGEPRIKEEEALQLAIQTTQGQAANAPTIASQKPVPGQNVTTNVKTYQRQLPQTCLTNNLCASMAMPNNQNPRFYRVQSTALTQNGLQTTITKVILLDRQNRTVESLYYLEE
jgi:hypothetical protein